MPDTIETRSGRDEMTREDREAMQRLRDIIRGYGPAAVAFSGGVDSTFLLAVAHEVSGPRVMAITAVSPLYIAEEIEFARQFAAAQEIKHVLVPGADLSSSCFAANPEDRCYHCKLLVLQKAREIAAQHGMQVLMDATHQDDLGDYRPGFKAVTELGVKSPLLAAGIIKAQIRRLSREMGLPWDRPSQACLASRFPYGTAITAERLEQVSRAERVLRELGFRVARVRYHGAAARVEVGEDEIARLLEVETRRAVHDGIREAGFKYVALDLQGYRTGSMNEGRVEAGGENKTPGAEFMEKPGIKSR